MNELAFCCFKNTLIKNIKLSFSFSQVQDLGDKFLVRAHMLLK